MVLCVQVANAFKYPEVHVVDPHKYREPIFHLCNTPSVRFGRRPFYTSGMFCLQFSASCPYHPSPPALPELLVLAWGVFFVTKSRGAEPTLKARNFTQVLQRGASKKRKRRKFASIAAEEAGGDGARPPDWDLSDDDIHVSDGSDSGLSDEVCDIYMYILSIYIERGTVVMSTVCTRRQALIRQVQLQTTQTKKSQLPLVLA